MPDREKRPTWLENSLLREMIGGKPLGFTDEQRRCLNAFIERFIRSIDEECLDRAIPQGRRNRENPSARTWLRTMQSVRIRVLAVR